MNVKVVCIFLAHPTTPAIGVPGISGQRGRQWHRLQPDSNDTDPPVRYFVTKPPPALLSIFFHCRQMIVT